MDPQKIEAIKNWPLPLTTVKQIRGFLGITSYYRKFVEGYASIADPITKLLKKDEKIKWEKEQEEAAQMLKDKLTTAPILRLPDFNLPFEVTTDASDFAVGAVLTQTEGTETRPVAFESRKLNSAERNYSTYEKEMLAIINALRVWRPYLLGKRFIVHTDHCPLSHKLNSKYSSNRLNKWTNFMNEFDICIKYKPGKENVVADALSRRHDYEESYVNLISVINCSMKFLKHLSDHYINDKELGKCVTKEDNKLAVTQQFTDKYKIHNDLLY